MPQTIPGDTTVTKVRRGQLSGRTHMPNFSTAPFSDSSSASLSNVASPQELLQGPLIWNSPWATSLLPQGFTLHLHSDVSPLHLRLRNLSWGPFPYLQLSDKHVTPGFQQAPQITTKLNPSWPPSHPQWKPWSHLDHWFSSPTSNKSQILSNISWICPLLL